jgi:hypothetical protein
LPVASKFNPLIIIMLPFLEKTIILAVSVAPRKLKIIPTFNESALLFNEGTLQVSLPQFPPPPELSMIFMPVNLCYDL